MLKLDIRDIVGDGVLCCAADGVPSLENLDTISFSKESLTQVIGDYIYNDCCSRADSDTENTVNFWLYDGSKKHWFDIKKDANGDYYFIAGDQSGIVYFGKIDRVKVIFHDYEVWFNEDEDYYYIIFQGKSDEYSKKDWTLEDAIFDMERVLAKSLYKIIKPSTARLSHYYERN